MDRFSRSAKAVKQLASSSPEDQISGLHTLQGRADEDGATLLSKRPDCLPGAVQVLRSCADSKVKKEAAIFLAVLADSARDRVGAEPGTVEGLVGCLHDSSAETRLAGLRALAKLLLLEAEPTMRVDRTLQDRVGYAPGAVAAIVQLLSSTGEGGVKIAGVDLQAGVHGLRKMLKGNTVSELAPSALRDAANAAGRYMTNKLGSNFNMADMHAAAAEVLACLAHNHPTNQAGIASVPGAAAALVTLLRSTNPAEQLAAADAVFELSEGNQTTQELFGQQPSTFPALMALLLSPDPAAQRKAVCALSVLVSMAPSNTGPLMGCPQATHGLLSTLRSPDARVAGAAGAGLVWLGLHSPVGQRMLEDNAVPVCTALGYLTDPRACPGQSAAQLLAQALQKLAGDSAAFLQAMRNSTQAQNLLRKLHSSTNDMTCNSAGAALEMVAPGSVKPVDPPAASAHHGNGACDSSNPGVQTRDVAGTVFGSSAPRDTARVDQNIMVRSGPGTALIPQTREGGSEGRGMPGGKFATATELIKLLEVAGKAVPIIFIPNVSGLGNLGNFIKPAATFFDLVEQARVNKAKAHSMKNRVQAMLEFMLSMISSGEQLQQALERNPIQLAALRKQFERLHKALMDALELVKKWSKKPWPLNKFVRFIKAKLDYDDIKDVENGINKGVADLTTVLSALNLVQSAEMNNLLQEKLAAVNVQAVPFEVMQQEDLQELQSCMTELLGGQHALSEQLSAASAELKAEWVEAQGLMSKMAADLKEILAGVAAVGEDVKRVDSKVDSVHGMVQDMNARVCDLAGLLRSNSIRHDPRLEGIERDMKDLKAAMIEELRKLRSDSGSNGVAAAPIPAGRVNSKGNTVRSRLLLSNTRVKWGAGKALDSGGFSSVYEGTYDGAPVAIKQLDMSALAGKVDEEMYYEAAVLSNLENHPCIVHFYGLLIEENDGKPPAATPGVLGRSSYNLHDSAGSNSLSALANPGFKAAGSGKAVSKFSAALVMERCDTSLQAILDQKPFLDVGKVLHIASCIAGGLKYLHVDAPIQVVHADLKPANVLIKGNDVKLTDFGLSHTIAVNTMATMAAQGLMNCGGSGSGGTILWAAPELLEAWAQGKDPPRTPEGDIYAFGLILYQLLVGKVPFEGQLGNIESIKSAVRRGMRPDWGNWDQEHLQQLQDGVPAAVVQCVLDDLQRLVQECWTQVPKLRPGAVDVLDQLEGIKSRLQGAI